MCTFRILTEDLLLHMMSFLSMWYQVHFLQGMKLSSSLTMGRPLDSVTLEMLSIKVSRLWSQCSFCVYYFVLLCILFFST